jgi:hypothetical protein
MEGLCKSKNVNDLIWHRTRGLPACSIVPEPTTLPRAPCLYIIYTHPRTYTYPLGLLVRCIDYNAWTKIVVRVLYTCASGERKLALIYGFILYCLKYIKEIQVVHITFEWESVRQILSPNEDWTLIFQLSEKLYHMGQLKYCLLYCSTIGCRIYCSQIYTACLKRRNLQCK